MPGINPLNAKLNPICHLLVLLESHHILHFSRIRVNGRLFTSANCCTNQKACSEINMMFTDSCIVIKIV